MPGPPPKPTARRQRARHEAGVVAAPTVSAPKAPSGLLAATRGEWRGFWAGPLASLVVDSDLPTLARLFECRDRRRRRYLAKVDEDGPLVEGSTGQQVAHPLLRQVSILDGEVRQLEDRFGLSPMARLKLGAQLGDAKRSLADLDAVVAARADLDPRFGGAA